MEALMEGGESPACPVSQIRVVRSCSVGRVNRAFLLRSRVIELVVQRVSGIRHARVAARYAPRYVGARIRDRVRRTSGAPGRALGLRLLPAIPSAAASTEAHAYDKPAKHFHDPTDVTQNYAIAHADIRVLWVGKGGSCVEGGQETCIPRDRDESEHP